MGKIYVIGLGPGSVEDLTLGAVKRIEKGSRHFVRTENHPTIEYFKEKEIVYKSFDYLYETKDEFKDVYETIADTLLKEAKGEEDINYFVPGNPLVAEKTVEILIERGEDIEIVTGMSFIDPLIMSVKRDPINGLKIVDGTVFDFGMIDINMDTIVTQVYNQRIISEIKIILSEVYGDEYKIYIIDSAGIKNQEIVENIPIYMLDRFEKIGYLTSIYIPRIEKTQKEVFDFSDIIKIMEKLRGEDGCPWDIKQTHESLRACMLEEAYELVDAIDKGDVDSIIEELGDVLLQVIFHANIASDEGEFGIMDVTTALASKLIFRHPHIFLDEKVVNSEEVVYNWDRLKELQQGLKTTQEKMDHISGLPSLIKGLKIQELAAKVGFDWPDVSGAIEKIKEEYLEVIEVVDSSEENFEREEEEIGDLFFTVVNLARFLNIDPEVAMNRANHKFIDRFKFMEERSKEMETNLKDMSLDEMEELWNLAKKNKF
nr:nucleoside triphosphate pyrophosphohydrolase [Tissierella sp.]